MRSTFDFNLTFADYVAASRRAGLRIARSTRKSWSHYALSVLIGLASGYTTYVLLTLASKHTGDGMNLASVAFGGFLAVLVLSRVSSYVRAKLTLRRCFSDSGPILGQWRLQIEPDGLRMSNATSESYMSWGHFRDVEGSSQAVLLFVDLAVFVAIPATAFTSNDEREQFVNLVRERCARKDQSAQLQLALEHGSVPASPTGALPMQLTGPARPPALAGFFRDLRRNLRAGAKLLVFRRVRPDDFTVSVEQLLALIVIDVVFMFVTDVLAVGLHGEINRWGLPGALFRFPLLVLASYVVARLERDTRLTLTLPIAALAATQYIAVVGLLLYSANYLGWLDLSPRPVYYAYYWGPYLWAMLVTVSAVLRLTQRRTFGWFVYVALIAAIVLVPQWFIPRDATGPLWLETSSDEAQDEKQRNRWYAVASEEAFYAQPEILQHSLAALTPGRPGVPDLYFVGVAGYARQDVFRNELSVIAPLIDQRFGTAGHSINLINNPDTALGSPIATVTSLQRTVARIGKLMNRDEDVLMLYLTSHGSHDHRFSLEFWPLHLRDLDAPTLKQMLDASGIRWRVIVVSACYSGGFIEPLKDEHTLVITAADADHTSFGCSNEAKLTYFGQAYFDEALRKTRSFTEAYEIARRSIQTRERTEDLTPSNPQMFVGTQMALKLKELEARWNRRQ